MSVPLSLKLTSYYKTLDPLHFCSYTRLQGSGPEPRTARAARRGVEGAGAEFMFVFSWILGNEGLGVSELGVSGFKSL